MKKFAFYISNKGTRLKKFLALYRNEELIKQIEFVLIDNCINAKLRNLCKELNIKIFEIDTNDKKDKNTYISNLFLKYLGKYDVNYAFIFADKILVGELLIKYKNKLINFHPAILPSHKGLYAIDKALKSNTFLLGNSAHIVTDELDNGRVIMQNIFPAINFKSYDEVLDNQLIMIFQLMLWIEQDRLITEKNNNIYIKGGSYRVEEFIPNIELEENNSHRVKDK